MKNRFWILVIAAIFVISAVIAVLQYTHKGGGYAEVYQNGVLLRTVDLKTDAEFTISSENGGFNTIQVKGGAISVIDASCPDKVCIHQGAISNGGQPIVCLPNKLVIKIAAPSPDGPDIVVG